MKRFFITLLLCLTALSGLFLKTSIADDSIRIAILGDFLPAGSAEDIIAKRGYGYLFDGVRPVLASVDAVVLNLETPLSTLGESDEGKTYSFRASPAVAPAMRDEGVRVALLANNHIMDFGPQALVDTIANLEAAGIAHAGADLNVGDAYAPALFRVAGRIAAVQAYSNTFPESYWAKKDSPGTAFGSSKAVKRGVPEARAAADGPVIVSFHWGSELMPKPKEYQTDLAHLAIDNGASLVVGHHPHVPQTIEVYRGVPVVYSLGNFSFGSYSRNSRVGLMVVAHFEKEGRCSLLEVYPLLVDNYEVHFSPRPLTGYRGKDVIDPLVRGIDPGAAEVTWDGEKGVIVPKMENGGK